jgi:hypothetical protein
MTRPKLKLGQKVKREAYDILANPVVSATLNDEQYEESMARFIFRENHATFEYRYSNLIRKTRFGRLLNSSARTIEEFFAHKLFGKTVSSDRLAIIYKQTFIARRAEISEFCEARKKFETHFLKGNYENADSVLEECKESLGESFWYLRCKFSVLIARGSIDELEQFSKKSKDRAGHELTSLIIRYSLLLENDPTLHFNRTVLRTINTLDEAGLQDVAAILRLLFCPVPLTCFPDNFFGFRYIQIFPLVDQVCLLEKFVNEAVATHGLQADPFNFKEIIASAKGITGKNDALQTSTVVYELTKLYEMGEYENLIGVFAQYFDMLEVPFVAINIVAKAAANAPHVPLPFPKSPLSGIIQSLVRIYRLDAPPATLEEDFKSLAIKFNHFYGSHCIQLCIYKALPHRYNKNRISWAAKAAARYSIGTQLSCALATGIDPILDYKYISSEDGLVGHRRVKASIRDAWVKRDFETISMLLSDYKKQASLPKDYVELAASYYLETNAFQNLLEFSASVLSENPRMYVALPIERIVDFASAAKISTLESIVVYSSYVEHVNEQKEYILHEAYEEYLTNNQVDRPTELLKHIENPSGLELVFFRDISAVETMDYLSCFNDSNELRSERVQILDMLREKRLISAEAHRTEVDEIVGQVVVDAGAAEFNANKIEVNTAALKRSLLPDVTSMLQIYRSLSGDEQPDQKSFHLANDYNREDKEGDSDEEKIRSLVAGDKNTALLRLLVHISDAFLTDEKHGLDKNLSTEIRHGFFANLMRSRLEEYKLITEIDETGNYKSNQHWRDVNSLLKNEILDEIDAHLATFSGAVNGLIERAEEWMKVSRSKSQEKVFVFEVYLADLEAMRPYAEEYEADKFLDTYFDFLWVCVEERLSEIRERLNVTFKDAIDSLFDDLLVSVERTRLNFPLSELISTIVQVKSGIREDITVASEWFKRSQSITVVSRTIEELIKISLECFFRIRGVYLSCLIRLPQSMQRIKIAGRHSKAFIVVIVNLLENACRGSGMGTNTPISIIGEDSGASWSISIENPIPQSGTPSDPGGIVSVLDAKMRSPLSIPLMRNEGGSGLAKVFNQLRLIDERFDVKLNLMGSPYDTFEVRIIYEI